MRRQFFIAAACLLSMTNITYGQSIQPAMQTQVIETDPGPEDMLFDSSETPRLIISCGDFFKGKTSRKGSIYYYDIKNNLAAPFTRVGLPKGLQFFPHGIAQHAPSNKLYVIVHDSLYTKKGNGIVVFTIRQNELVFETLLQSKKYLKTPNDLTVTDDGNIYITNDGGFSLWKIISRLFIRRSFVARYDPATKEFRRAYKRMMVANGIHAIGNKVYIVDSFKKSLRETEKQEDGSLRLLNKIPIAKNMDNITSNDRALYIPSHDSSLKLKAARKKHSIKPPFTVHKLDLLTKKSTVIYHSADGKPISAVSTAIYHDGSLYLSQIFDPFIIKLKYP